jgi:hypothetical protein
VQISVVVLVVAAFARFASMAFSLNALQRDSVGVATLKGLAGVVLIVQHNVAEPLQTINIVFHPFHGNSSPHFNGAWCSLL